MFQIFSILQSCRKPAVTRTVAKVEVKKQLEQKLAEGKEISKELIANNARQGTESAEAESYGDEDEEDTVDEAPSIVDEISAKGHKKLAMQGALQRGCHFDTITGTDPACNTFPRITRRSS